MAGKGAPGLYLWCVEVGALPRRWRPGRHPPAGGGPAPPGRPPDLGSSRPYMRVQTAKIQGATAAPAVVQVRRSRGLTLRRRTTTVVTLRATRARPAVGRDPPAGRI